jgi:alkylated DNA nucleotide flippase Atl1
MVGGDTIALFYRKNGAPYNPISNRFLTPKEEQNEKLMLLATVGLSVAARAVGTVVTKAGLEGANYAQRTFSSMFGKAGKFAGMSVDEVATALRSGAMKVSEVPVDFIVRDGNKLILNTRSAKALEAAGISRSEWNVVNRTGQELYEKLLSGRLQRNGLASEGIETVKQIRPRE